jgi:[acyl-carrier-protein] S-malonyltransferase
MKSSPTGLRDASAAAGPGGTDPAGTAGPGVLAFPGQGVPAPIMAEALDSCRADALAARLARYLGQHDWAKIDYADTRVSQPATLVASLSLARRAEMAGISVVLGHSLGELTALTYAGAMSEDVAFDVVARRAEFSHEQHVRVPGRMVALIGADLGQAEWIRRMTAARTGLVVDIGALNNPTQTVLSGDAAAIDQVISGAGEAGVIAAPMTIGGAFHSSLMGEAADRFSEYLRHIPVRAPVIEVFSTILCQPLRTPDDVRSAMIKGLVMPVRWAESLRILHSRGVHRAVDVGPGVTLTKISRSAGGTVVRPLAAVK